MIDWMDHLKKLPCYTSSKIVRIRSDVLQARLGSARLQTQPASPMTDTFLITLKKKIKNQKTKNLNLSYPTTSFHPKSPSPQTTPTKKQPKEKKKIKKSTPNLPKLPHPLLQTLRLFPRNLLNLIRNPRAFSPGNSHIQIRHIMRKIRLETSLFDKKSLKSVARKSDVKDTPAEDFGEDCCDLEKEKKRLVGWVDIYIFLGRFFLNSPHHNPALLSP